MVRTLRVPVLGTLAALGLAIGAVPAAATPALAVTCPAVDSAGNVTPAPSPGADWQGCNLTGANLASADLSGAQLQNANLTNGYLPHADLANANLSGATLFNGNASGANLSGADLTSTSLSDTFVDDANLESANLTGTYAWGAHLIGSDFRNATVQGADLSYADLTSATFFGASMANLTATSTTWTHAICPNGASADYYTAGCLSPVAVTKPAATPTITAGTPGQNGWYTSPVTVTWYWVDSNPLSLANCPVSTDMAAQGQAVAVSASCSDMQGNVGNASFPVNIDTTPPVVALPGVTAGAVYALALAPQPHCTTADAVSGVARNAGTGIEGTLGQVTVICTGAQDNAGNTQAAPLTVQYTVVYGFDGFLSPKPGSKLRAAAKSITVAFRLLDVTGLPLPAANEAAVAAAHEIRATLAGPGISPRTAACRWNASRRYQQCTIARPAHLKTGTRHRYSITVAENLGNGWVKAPGANPEPVYFR